MARKEEKRSALSRTVGLTFSLVSLALLAVVATSLVVVAGTTFFAFQGKLPELATLKAYQPPLVTRIYAADGTVVGEFYVEKRVWVPYARIPKRVVEAFVAAEDARFFEHKGIDLWGILRAMTKNLEAGGLVQGGSTITQQVAKMILLTPERSLTRKIKEMITAIRIERNFTKQEILELYLNQIYLGHGAYGVGQAAETYFGKKLERLTLGEIALLAGLPPGPARYSPVNYPGRARAREKYVLSRMVAQGYITEKEANQAQRASIKIVQGDTRIKDNASYFVEHIRRYMEERYGTDLLYKGGLVVRTTLLPRLQNAATEAILTGLKELDKVHGYRGPQRRLKAEEVAAFIKGLPPLKQNAVGLELGQMASGVVERIDARANLAYVRLKGGTGLLDLSSMQWAGNKDSTRLARGDVIQVRLEDRGTKGQLVLSLEQAPLVQGALLAMEPGTGFVRAMVGGSDFRRTQYNRAVQAQRQPGSAFKPIIYTAALDAGYTPTSIINDTPVTYRAGEAGQYWQPRNYDNEYKGPVTFRRALEESRNVVTVKILESIGVDYVISYARKMGIASPLVRNLSLALGSSSLNLLELTRAYAILAAQGYMAEPIFITEIRDRDNRLLEKNSPKLTQVISSQTAYIMTHVMEGVIQAGTGRTVRSIGRPAAGKTGTTDDFVDAWFIGFTPQLVAGVWVGYDDRTPLGYGQTGARAASPIWLRFMTQALAQEPALPFPVPEDIVVAPVNRNTGRPASWDSPDAVIESFRADKAPANSLREQPDDGLKEQLPR